MRRATALLPLAVVAALAGCAPTTASGVPVGGVTPITAPPAASPTGGVSAEAWVSSMLARVNAERANAGLGPLQLCGNLGTAAQRHSDDQAARSVMSHTGSNGSTMAQRVQAAGYVGWNALAENVAAGQPTVDSVVSAWMGSAGHRANLLSATYVHVGFGRATSSSGTPYWTQDFGRGGSC